MTGRASQESASSLTSVILSIDLRISATRFSVSAPDTSCLKHRDQGYYFSCAKAARDRSKGESPERTPQINHGLPHWTLWLSSGPCAVLCTGQLPYIAKLSEGNYNGGLEARQVHQKLILNFALCLAKLMVQYCQ